jgi:hypothetical protein
MGLPVCARVERRHRRGYSTLSMIRSRGAIRIN